MKESFEAKPIKKQLIVHSGYKVKPFILKPSSSLMSTMPDNDDLQWKKKKPHNKKLKMEDNLKPTNFSKEISFSQLQRKFIDDLNDQHTPNYFNKKISPTLAHLRYTPVQRLNEKRKILIQKHEDIRLNSSKLATGGGFSLWPEMEKMKLDKKAILYLATFSVAIAFLVGYSFLKIHGSTLDNLNGFSLRIKNFSSNHPIYTVSTSKHFQNSIQHWHTDFHSLLNEIVLTFDTSQPCWDYQVYILSYIGGLFTLIFYLFDNIYTKTRLTPRRIKRWVVLLTVISVWSAMMLFLFKAAQNLEHSIESNVYKLNEIMGKVLLTEFDVDYFQKVLQYWQTRCLLPSSRGTIIIWGVFSLHDIRLYLHYYTIPLLTIILSPLIRLFLALYSIYKPR